MKTFLRRQWQATVARRGWPEGMWGRKHLRGEFGCRPVEVVGREVAGVKACELKQGTKPLYAALWAGGGAIRVGWVAGPGGAPPRPPLQYSWAGTSREKHGQGWA